MSSIAEAVSHALEENGSLGSVAHEVSYPYDQDDSFVPYRLNGVILSGPESSLARACKQPDEPIETPVTGR